MRKTTIAAILAIVALAGCIGNASPDEAPDDQAESSGQPDATPKDWRENGERSSQEEGTAANGSSQPNGSRPAYNLSGPLSQPLQPGEFDILEPELFALESPVDGAQIEVGLFRPDVPEDHQMPVLVYASPYMFSGMSKESMRQHYMHTVLVENFVPHGYAVAFLPVRGTADQGGCAEMMGPRERADLDHAVTHLGSANWSNGNVGMYGASYDGATGWEVASVGNPHLETIVPASGVNDMYRLLHANGTNEYLGPGTPGGSWRWGFLDYNAVQNGRSPEHMIEGALCPEALEGMAASGYATVTGERDPEGYWAERNLRPGVEENYNGSVLLVQGLQDWNVEPSHQYPWVNTLDEHGITVKHMLGQWGHALPDYALEDEEVLSVLVDGEVVHPRMDWAQIMLQWFDHWLKGQPSDLGPTVEVQDSAGRWRSEEAWPPQDATATQMWAHPGGLLESDPTSETDSVMLVPRNDQAEGAGIRVGSTDTGRSGDVCDVGVCFTSAMQEEPLRFAGIPTAELTVTPQGPGGHVEVRLYSEDVDGDRTRLGWGQVDLRFAHGGEEARQVTPGETMEVDVWLEPLDAVVRPGEKLVFRVSQSSYGDHLPSAPTYPVEMHLGDGQSGVSLETFERGEGVFFDPPSKR